MQRDPALQTFTDAVLAAFTEVAPKATARASLGRIAVALSAPAPGCRSVGRRVPVCRHLEAALAVETPQPPLRRVIDAFRAVEPDLEWQRRASRDETASANWLSVSLMAPSVRYTDHAHAPYETYRVLSEGEFCQGRGGVVRSGYRQKLLPSFVDSACHALGKRTALRFLGAFAGLGPTRRRG